MLRTELWGNTKVREEKETAKQTDSWAIEQVEKSQDRWLEIKGRVS